MILFLDLRTLILLIILHDSFCLYLSENADGTHYHENENRIKSGFHKDKEFYSKYSSDLVENSLKYFTEIGTTLSPSKNVFKTKSKSNNHDNNENFMSNFSVQSNRNEFVNKTTTDLPFSIILDTPPLIDDSSTEITAKINQENTEDKLETEFQDSGGNDVWYVTAFKFVRKLLIECRTKSMGSHGEEETPLSYLVKMQRCARNKILTAVDRAIQADELRLSDTVFLVKEETSVHNVSGSSPTVSTSSRESDLQYFTTALGDRVYRLLQSHAVRIRIGDMQNTGRHSHHFSKTFSMMVAAFMLMASFMVPMNFQFLAVLGGKAILLLSQIAIIMALTGKTLNFSGVTDYFKHEIPQWIPPQWKTPEPAPPPPPVVHHLPQHPELVDNSLFFPLRKSGTKPLAVNKYKQQQTPALQLPFIAYQQLANRIKLNKK